MKTRVFFFLIIGSLLSASCTSELDKTSNVSATEEELESVDLSLPAEPPPLPSLGFSWGSVPPSTVDEISADKANLLLSEGYVYAVASKTEVYPNDVVTASFEVSGPVGEKVTAIVQRHCNPERGEDATIHTFVLSGAPQTESVSHKFEQQYSCFRLSLLSTSKASLKLSISKTRLTVQTGHYDPTFSFDDDLTLSRIRSARDDFGKTIFYFGDSISRGAVLRKFPDQFTEEEARFERYWDQRSPAAVSNTVRSKSGAVAVYAGPSGQPHFGNTELVNRLLEERTIRPGDVIVFEDAGQHNKSPQTYFENWIELRSALADAGVFVVLVTTPDFVEGISDAEAMKYDLEFGGMTHNQATRQASVEPIAGNSETKLLDLDALLDDRKFFLEDGIHLNLHGQCVFVQNVHLLANLPLPKCVNNSSTSAGSSGE